MAMINNDPRESNFIAVSPLECLVVSRAELMRIMVSNPLSNLKLDQVEEKYDREAEQEKWDKFMRKSLRNKRRESSKKSFTEITSVPVGSASSTHASLPVSKQWVGSHVNFGNVGTKSHLFGSKWDAIRLATLCEEND
eukprot:343645_1